MEWTIGRLLPEPVVEVLDEGTTYRTVNPSGLLSLQQVAVEYGAWSLNQTTRSVEIRQLTATGIGQPETFEVPYVAPLPLEVLAWNQGWPQPGAVPVVDVLDDNTHFWAPNPDGWDHARAAADYGDSYACENKTPHEVQIRTCTPGNNGDYEPFTVPVLPEE